MPLGISISFFIHKNTSYSLSDGYMVKRELLLLIAAMLLPAWAWCQPGSVIRLTNPSFEGTPKPATLPDGWTDCGFERESPPDTQPGHFRVTRKAYDGKTYLGMVVRDNGTNESISQQMSDTIKAGRCYLLKVMLSRSDVFQSSTFDYRGTADYKVPAVLRVYGGTTACSKLELLAASTPVDHFKWKKYELILKPHSNYTHIVLAAEYEDNNKWFYNGHILVDHLSDIKEVVCDER